MPCLTESPHSGTVTWLDPAWVERPGPLALGDTVTLLVLAHPPWQGGRGRDDG